jgi:hypothetical protein
MRLNDKDQVVSLALVDKSEYPIDDDEATPGADNSAQASAA